MRKKEKIGAPPMPWHRDCSPRIAFFQAGDSSNQDGF
jgi:hypothetical protein